MKEKTPEENRFKFARADILELYDKGGMSYRELYQRLYSDSGYSYKEHGDGGPAYKNYNEYSKFLESPIIELGCGWGYGVLRMRQMGFKADGMDWVSLDNGMRVGDITGPLDIRMYKTAVCIDVLEHLSPKGVDAALKNMTQCPRAVLSVAIIPDKSTDGRLHITLWTFDQWEKKIKEYFTLHETRNVSDWQRIYLCKEKTHG